MENLKFKSRFTQRPTSKATFEELDDDVYCPNAIKFIYCIGEALGRTDLISKRYIEMNGETITKYFLSSADLEWLNSKFT